MPLQIIRTEDCRIYNFFLFQMCSGKPDGEQLPNFLSCASYFVCIHGFPQLFHCNDHLYYDPSLKVCNWPQNVTCAHVAGPDVSRQRN